MLTYSGVQSDSRRTASSKLNTYIGGSLYHLVKYGPSFLNTDEYSTCRARILNEYYNFLAVNLTRRGRDTEFWTLHKKWLKEAGFTISRSQLSIAVLLRAFRAVTHPWETLEKFRLTRARGY